jgi:hypothetical protein
MIEPASYDPNKTPTIRWAGKDWPVPPLVADQLDMIWDDTIALTKILFAQDEAAAAAPAATEDEKLRRGLEIVVRRYDLTREQYKALRTVVYYGLTRAHPALSEAEFRDQPATSLEMLMAFFTVRRQSGIFGEFSEGDAPSGEAKATESQTSNGSSPA